MLRRLWKFTTGVLLVIGLALSFFALIEVIRAYEVLRDLHPAVGYAFLVLLGCALIALAAWYAYTIGQRPRALVFPPGVDPQTATGRDLRRYARFQLKLMLRLSVNARLPDVLQAELQAGAEHVRELLAAATEDESLLEQLLTNEATAVRIAVKALDRAANEEVSRSVRDVMLAVTLSPWRSVDLLIVLYRNLRMVMRLALIYNTRPALREQVAILRDVFTVVATVNFLNYGSRLLQNLTSSVPLLGRFADDVAQGIGAGLLTSVAGHAAIDRCHTFGHWDKSEAERTLHAKLKDFMVDVKGIVTTDVLQRLRKPVEAQIPEDERPPEMQKRLQEGIADAIDETASAMETFFIRPVAAAGRGVAETGAAVGKAVVQGGTATVMGVAGGGKAIARFGWGAVAGTGKAAAHAVTGSGRFVGRQTRAAAGRIRRWPRKNKRSPANQDDV